MAIRDDFRTGYVAFDPAYGADNGLIRASVCNSVDLPEPAEPDDDDYESSKLQWEWVQPGFCECINTCCTAAEALEDATKHASREGGSVWLYQSVAKDNAWEWIESEEFSWNANGELRRV